VPRIRPFAGLLYAPERAGPLDLLTAPPYDVISRHEQRRLHSASPFNVVRLIRGEDLPGDDERTSSHSRAAQLLGEWRRSGILVPSTPAVFPYEFRFRHQGAERTVQGIVAQVELEAFGRDVLAHERTMPGPTLDRLALLRAVRANLSPVHAVYASGERNGRRARGMAAVRNVLEATDGKAPAAEATDDEGTRHRIWIHPDADAVCAALSGVQLMIADGHHRYAVAWTVRQEMRASSGPGPWDSLMMLLVDATAEDPPVLPIHRALLPDRRRGESPSSRWHAQAGERVRDLEEVLRTVTDDPPIAGLASFESAELRHRVLSLENAPPAVRALHDGPLRDVRPGRLRYLHDAVAAEQMVRAGRAEAAFFLPPTSIGVVRNVIAAGDTLPEKSTYFWPKPRTGLVIRPFDA
jgi:uncharacterized protein (DUF1015 family)